MEGLMLVLFVFVLGLRHGLDADHLACIDGLARYNWRKGNRIARWTGALFSFGHGLVVAGVAATVGMFTRHFTFPSYFDDVAVWVSVVSLFLLGTLNAYYLLRTQSDPAGFRVQGIRVKLIPRVLRETSNPILIVLIGALFAMTAETVSQTSVWVLAAGSTVPYMSLVLGAVFMMGMMLTDTIDSLITYQMINQPGKKGRSASRVMGWIIVALAYGVSFYNAFLFFNPWAEIDYELVGVCIFVVMLAAFVWVIRRGKSQPVIESQ